MSCWSGLVGQDEAVKTLRSAVINPDNLTHGWLFTGPPGSGRSNLALAFASALLSPESGRGGSDSDPKTDELVRCGSHPDLTILRTEKVIISIDEARRLIEKSALAPILSGRKILLVEDADRMSERTANVLLKSLEEPLPRVFWFLCAPSSRDLLPTIRSRLRTIRLRQPKPIQVAEFLVSQCGIDKSLAEEVSLQALGHVGIARRLAQNEEARSFRRQVLELALDATDVSQSVFAAGRIYELALTRAKLDCERVDRLEYQTLLKGLGLGEADRVPPALRSQFSALAEEQKRRSTRSLRDVLDRVLLDLVSVYRDVLLSIFGADSVRANPDLTQRITALTDRLSAKEVYSRIEALQLARERLGGNVSPLLALEAALVN